jgi:hypothetical protein
MKHLTELAAEMGPVAVTEFAHQFADSCACPQSLGRDSQPQFVQPVVDGTSGAAVNKQLQVAQANADQFGQRPRPEHRPFRQGTPIVHRGKLARSHAVSLVELYKLLKSWVFMAHSRIQKCLRIEYVGKRPNLSKIFAACDASDATC